MSNDYNQWLEQRQAYWDNINNANSKYYTLRNNPIRTTSYRSSDEYYESLGAQIEARQRAAEPIAGEGLMEFLPYFSGAMRLGSRFFPPLSMVAHASDAVLLYLKEEGYGPQSSEQ